MKELRVYLDSLPNSNLVYMTIALIAIYLIIKTLIIKAIDFGDDGDFEEKITHKRRVSNYGSLILIIGIFSLWFSQLQTVFVSMLAFAAAIVLAFKEVIMCITGGMVIRFNKHFSIGDRIEVDGTRGFVIDRTLTATKVLEIGPEKNSQQTTGNIVTIPNSIFLSKSAINQSYFQNFSIRSFMFSPIKLSEFEKSEELLLSIAKEICAEYYDDAKNSILNFCHKEGINIISVEPRVKLLLLEDNEAKLLLKMPVDNKRIGDIEQTINRRYFKEFVKRIKD